jgi:hypothetical protein
MQVREAILPVEVRAAVTPMGDAAVNLPEVLAR